MPVLSAVTEFPGWVSVLPRPVSIKTNDTQATILVAGYLNSYVQMVGQIFSNEQMALVETTDNGLTLGWYQISISGVNTSLVEASASGVLLPVVANHIATFVNSAGEIGDQAVTAIQKGSLQAGLSGTAGSLISFPSTASKGSLALTAVANTGDTVTTISNAAMGQASTVSIPDPGVASSKFILSDSAGTQTIATGSLALTLGSVTATAGNLQAGSSGHAGTVTSFPGTAANGSLKLAAANDSGNKVTTISNGTMAQDTVYSIGDIGAATGGIVVATSAVRMKSVAGAAAAGGNAAQSFTDAFCTSASNVIGNWNTQANAASVLQIVPGNGSFVVTSSADAGVGTFNYIIIK